MFDELMRAGWPALEEVAVDGWIVRFAAGVTNRANSVVPLRAPRDLGSALDQVEGLYAERGLNAVFQVGATARPAELDQVLAGRGYAFGSPTGVHTVDVDRALVRLGAAGGETAGAGPAVVEIAEFADRAWLDLWWAVDGRGDADALAVAEKILAGGPALFGTIRDDDRVLAVGRLALVGDWGGVYCLAVDPSARRRGLGGAVLGGLLAAGKELGITRSWLQVREENSAARRLYRRAGYAEVTRYHYRSRR
jgi:ribosomal protein S18 acetylase RimI-like enzyme